MVRCKMRAIIFEAIALGYIYYITSETKHFFLSGTLVKMLEEEQRNLSTLKAQLKYIKEDWESTSKKIDETRRDVTAVKRSMEKLRPERESLERSISNRESEITKIENERNEIKRDILGDISERFGVDDIEEADRQREEQTREMNAEESALKDKTAKLNSQITYQKRRGKKLEEAKIKLIEKVCFVFLILRARSDVLFTRTLLILQQQQTIHTGTQLGERTQNHKEKVEREGERDGEEEKHVETSSNGAKKSQSCFGISSRRSENVGKEAY